MRILLVHHAYPPEGVGGSEIYTEALARHLSGTHEVAVLHRSADPERKDHDLVERRQDGLRIFSLNNRHREVSGFEAYRDARAAAAAVRVFEQVRPELVHIGHLEGLSTGLLFEARRLGAAVVWTLHDFWPLCPLGQLLNRRLEVCPGPTPRRCLGCVGAQAAAPQAARGMGLRVPGAAALGSLAARISSLAPRRIERRLEEMREALRAADLLLSPSRFLCDRYAALGVGGVELLELGHEPVAIGPRRPDPSGRVRLGFLGAVIPSKGVHILAEAFRLLDDPRAALSIHGPFVPYHGDTSYPERLRTLLGPHADEALRGPFPPARLGEVLAGLDVVVVPSLWEENAPLVVQEAAMAHLPVVVSDHGGLAERVRDGIDGLRFRPGDPGDLAQVLRRLLDEPGLLARLGQDPPPVPGFSQHVAALSARYERARARYTGRTGRVGVVVPDHSRPAEAASAARSVLDPSVPAHVLVVDDAGPGPEVELPPGVACLRLPERRGYAGAVNAGLERLLAAGCNRVLLLNSDAVLLPGALRRLAEALEDPGLAAVAPVVLRDADGRVESRGARFDPRWGRQKLAGHGEAPEPAEGLRRVESLPGTALMISAAALARVGPLDEAYFHGFEDTDWCARARAAGLGLAVVLGAVARHAGARTLGPGSPERLYYAARNHPRAAERALPRSGLARWVRRGTILALNLGYALRQRQVPRGTGVRAVLQGTAHFLGGRFGPRQP